MTDNSLKYFEGLVARGLTRPGATNHSIYDKRLGATYKWEPFKQDPYAIYFYYLKFESDNRPKVLHYFWNDGPLNKRGPFNPIPLASVEDVIQHLAQNARDGGDVPKPDKYNNFNDIEWRMISYIVILLEEDDWYFDEDGDLTGAIAFNTDKGSTPNHTFFDGANIQVTIKNKQGQDETRTAIMFVNHFKKNVAGEPILTAADRQKFVFDAYTLVSYSGQPGKQLRVTMDPDGTNLGPPLHP